MCDRLLYIFVNISYCLRMFFLILRAVIRKTAWTFNILNEISIIFKLIMTTLNFFMPLFYFDSDIVNFSFITLENIAFEINTFLLMFNHTEENEGLDFLFQYLFLFKFTHFIYKTIRNFIIFISGNPWMS